MNKEEKIKLFYETPEDELDEEQLNIKYSQNPVYLILWTATNNDTYQSSKFHFVCEVLPPNIKSFVQKQYDGVWEPNVRSIEVFSLKKIKLAFI